MEKSSVFVRTCAELAPRVLGAAAAVREVRFAVYAQRSILEAASRRGMAERRDLAGVEAIGKIGAIGRRSGVAGDVSVGWDVWRGVAAGEQACQEAGKTEGG
jgi:hypothetical protein